MLWHVIYWLFKVCKYMDTEELKSGELICIYLHTKIEEAILRSADASDVRMYVIRIKFCY